MTKIDVLAETEAIHAAYGRGDCPLMDFMRTSKLKGERLRAAVRARPDFEPTRDLVIPLRAQLHVYAGAALSAAARAQVAAITAYPFALLGRQVMILIEEHGELIPAEAWPPILAWFAAGHRAPKAFFEDPAILAKLPATDEIADLLTALPCGRAPWLAGKPLRGGRGA